MIFPDSETRSLLSLGLRVGAVVALSTPDSSFVLKDTDPEVMEAWRKLVSHVLESNPQKSNGAA